MTDPVIARFRQREAELQEEVKRLRVDLDNAHQEIIESRRSISSRLRVSKEQSSEAETRLQQAEASARQSENQFQMLVQGVVDYAIYMLDPTGHVTSWNSGAQRIKGYLPDEIIGDHYCRFFTDEDRKTGLPDQALKTALEAGTYSTEGWRIRKDGSRFWANVVLDPIRSEDGTLVGFAKVTRDITDWREGQQELEQARQTLAQVQKMEAIGQLTGGIAHDFNNLLTGIIGSLDLIQRRLRSGRTDGLDRYMDAATKSAQRAASLTQRLLAFSRMQSLDSTPQDIVSLVSGLRQLLSTALPENVRLEIEPHADTWWAISDANQLETALLNLAINARDAMPEGGRLKISTANKQVVETDGDLSAGDYVVICVEDTGTGMPPEIVEKAFNPFFTTKPIGQGTGLGLSMVYGFAKQSGGHVKIESQPGQGSTIILYLPRAPVGQSVARSDLMSETPNGRGETVLLVEDDEAVRLLVTEVLDELGYQYKVATDGRQALPHLEGSGSLDLLITDVGLPYINGRQLAEIARQHRPNLKVLFITGYAGVAVSRSEFLEHGMQMMTKPFDLDSLAIKIRELIEL